MPTYVCTTPAGRLSREQKAVIAQEVTRIHSEITGAPKSFAQVIFHDIPAGNHFLGGRLLEGDHLFLHGQIRAGRTDEVKAKLMATLAAALAGAAAMPANAIWVYIDDLASRQIMEFGRVLPEPGEEDAWFAALPAAERARLQG